MKITLIQLDAANSPGLGVEPVFDSLGDPVAIHTWKEK